MTIDARYGALLSVDDRVGEKDFLLACPETGQSQWLAPAA